MVDVNTVDVIIIWYVMVDLGQYGMVNRCEYLMIYLPSRYVSATVVLFH